MSQITFDKVTKRYGKITALDNVSFDIKEGEYITILGPTGSGKTTTLRLLAGLLKPDEGDIYFKGRRVNDLPPERRDVGLVFQNFVLFPHMNVWQNVTFGPEMKGWAREKTERLGRHMLELVHLYDRAKSYPSELSGGMQQRVALARALTSGSKIMLMDEPLGALDARLRVELRYELMRLMKDLNVTTIHVTHDQEEAMTISDKILVLRSGKVEQIGSPMELFLKPRSIFVANFVGENNFIEGIIKNIDRGLCEVELKEGVLAKVPSIEGNTLGERIVIAVRPENLMIKKGELREVNHIVGQVEKKRFLGTFIKYSIHLETEETVAARISTLYSDRTFEVGETVTVYFSAHEVIVYHHPPEGVRKEVEVE